MDIARPTVLALALVAGPAGCGSDADADDPRSAWIVDVPESFPTPVVPEDNPMSEARVELGRYLFYDRRLSGNGTQSCADCHHQDKAFSDGLATPLGSTGVQHPRNSMALVNTAYNSVYTWANPALATLEQQIAVPMFGEFPVELGITGFEDEVLQRLRDDERYPELFAAAFPGESDPFDLDNVIDALATFVRALVSTDSPFDRYVAGDTDALSESQLDGMRLFFSERLECHHCHGGFNFSFSTTHEDSAFVERAFHNTGLYDVDGEGAYPTGNAGLFDVTGDPADMGAFRAPSLRNVAVTAPYMHDGSVLTLEDVVRIYEAGGRVIEDGPYTGDGRLNPHKSGLVSGFILTDRERADLIAFLQSLTDQTFLTNPAYANPFDDER